MLLSCSWLLAPYANAGLRLGPNFVSEYESTGIPWSTVFRSMDFLGALLLLVTAVWLAKQLQETFGRWFYGALLTVGALGIIDAVVPLHCQLAAGICTPVRGGTFYIHVVESCITSLLIFGLSCFVALRKRSQIAVPIALIGFFITGMLLHAVNNHNHDIILQTASTLVQIYWLGSILLTTTRQSTDSVGTSVRTAMALLCAYSGVVAVALSSEHIVRGTHGRLNSFILDDYAWLAQHTLLSGMLMLLLARNIFRGSRLARLIVLWISFSQLIRYSFVTPEFLPVLSYGILVVLLCVFSEQFQRRQTIDTFRRRLTSILVTVLAVTFAATVASVGFRIGNLRAWDRSAFTVGRVASRVLLIEVRTDPHDPLKARLFSQMLTVLGGFLYIWLALGIFLPRKLDQSTSSEQRNRAQHLLDQYSTTSEDYFKLWPQDKNYWFGSGDAFVAYRVERRYAIALADPIGPMVAIQQRLHDFRNYATANHWQAVFLLASEQSKPLYEEAGFRILPIGASALVNIASFNESTIKDKWWRWVRNKATKSGLQYHVKSGGELTPHELEQLRAISNAWLREGDHQERGFALGYFDERALRQCTIHMLCDESGRIVSFTNQLPTYGSHGITTIDMMRSLPEYSHSTAFLLSEALQYLHTQTNYQQFDLGFVPLAHSTAKQTGQAIKTLANTALKPVFSAHGLRQFKQKFDPTWHTNYLAWDGDMLDLPAIGLELLKSLEYKKVEY